MPNSGGPTGIVWTHNSLRLGLNKLSPAVRERVAVILEYVGTEATAKMKREARWTDRTGNARATLAAETEHRAEVSLLTLHGGMPYQIFLETMQNGRFAIIRPTLKWAGKKVMGLVTGLLDGMGAGQMR